jgi:hypothetical protein
VVSDRISSAELVSQLVAIEGRPWAEWKAGREITQNGLARMLDSFGIRPGTIRLHTGQTPKGYYRSAFDGKGRAHPVEGVDMSAVEAVKVARAAGIELTLDGDGLLLDAASEPPSSLIEELRRHKHEIVNLLRSEHGRRTLEPGAYAEVLTKLRSTFPTTSIPTHGSKRSGMPTASLSNGVHMPRRSAGRHVSCSGCTLCQRNRRPIIRGCHATTRRR